MTSVDPAASLFAKGLITISLLCVIVYIIYATLANKFPIQPLVIVGFSIVSLFSVALFVGGCQWVTNREMLYSSILYPDNEPNPPYYRPPPPITQISPNALKLFFGTNTAFATGLPYNVFVIDGVPVLTLNRGVDGSITVETLRVFDDRGNSIARIDRNDFWVSANNRYKKPSPHELIVFDHADRQVLKIDYINKNAVQVEGIFYSPKTHAFIEIDPDMMKTSNGTFAGSGFGGGTTAIAVNG